MAHTGDQAQPAGSAAAAAGADIGSARRTQFFRIVLWFLQHFGLVAFRLATMGPRNMNFKMQPIKSQLSSDSPHEML